LSENKSDSRSTQYKELKAAPISLKANIALRQGTELRIKTLKENKKTAEDKLSGLLEKDSRQAQLGRDRESIARIKDHLSETLENYRSSFAWKTMHPTHIYSMINLMQKSGYFQF
jgi:hypothetical protein